MKPEREIAAQMAVELIVGGIIEEGQGTAAAEILLRVLNAHARRGLKDNEIAEVVNAVRDNLATAGHPDQFRGRIAAAMTDQLGKMNLRYDTSGG